MYQQMYQQMDQASDFKKCDLLPHFPINVVPTPLSFLQFCEKNTKKAP